MARLFVSYAREDAAVAGRLAEAFEASGHQIWWDRHLVSGAQFSEEIEREIEQCDRLVVLWSAASVKSPWVRDEAAAGRDLGKLVPLAIDRTTPPLGFRQFHALDLGSWVNGGALPGELLTQLGTALAAEDRPTLTQRVRFCKASDGARLAWSVVGDGTPILKLSNWLNHLEYEWGNPLWMHWIEAMSEGHRLIRYDQRGNGMSDWNIDTPTIEQMADDVCAVADAAGIERFDLLGISQGSMIGVAFAVRHPDRVRRMALVNGFAAGWNHSNNPDYIERWEAMVTLMRTGWGQDNPAFRQMFTSLFFPHATPQQAEWWNELQRVSATPDNAVKTLRLLGDTNVGSLLEQVRVPTMVMHCRHDHVIPFEAGRRLASGIPGAKFVVLESENHLILSAEPAWPKAKRELLDFFSGED